MKKFLFSGNAFTHSFLRESFIALRCNILSLLIAALPGASVFQSQGNNPALPTTNAPTENLFTRLLIILKHNFLNKTIGFLKALSFFFVFLITNSIYSQGTCGVGYSITSTYNSDCNYTFTPVIPGGAPTVDWYHWDVRSSGTYGVGCDTFATSAGSPNLNYVFCFSGTHDISVRIVFTDGTYCSMVIMPNITCSTGIVCDPSPSRTAPIPNPVVEITYMSPFVCLTGQPLPAAACMYSLRNGLYDLGCGWIYALRMPPTGSNCDYWTYYVNYTKVIAGCSTLCDLILLDTTVQCITAAVGTTIYIVATANSCCLPSGYQRGYYWTPSWTTQAPIGAPPNGPIGICSSYYTCPGNSVCNETQVTMSASSGWPSPPSCFSGGKKIEQRDFIPLDINATIEQDVSIYNLEGKEIFFGKWRFSSPNSPILNWPGDIGSGIYFVKFSNSAGKLTKLFKLN